jgi:hypothetical protein
MDYLANYYKNLCEQLQEKVNLLEAGLALALRTGDSARLEREKLKAQAREERGLQAVEAAGRRTSQAMQTYGASSNEAAIAYDQQNRADTSRQQVISNITDIERRLAEPSSVAERVWSNKKPLSQMTDEEAYRHGQDMARIQSVTPHPDMFKNPHFHRGFRDALSLGSSRATTGSQPY